MTKPVDSFLPIITSFSFFFFFLSICMLFGMYFFTLYNTLKIENSEKLEWKITSQVEIAQMLVIYSSERRLSFKPIFTHYDELSWIRHFFFLSQVTIFETFVFPYMLNYVNFEISFLKSKMSTSWSFGNKNSERFQGWNDSVKF